MPRCEKNETGTVPARVPQYADMLPFDHIGQLHVNVVA